MKAIKTSKNHYDKSFYLMPEQFENIDSFIEYINNFSDKFIKIKKLPNKSSYPYFIEEDVKEMYVKFNLESCIEIVDVTLIPRSEYITRLLEVVNNKCINCSSYFDNGMGEIENLRGHWSQINLDGECESFHSKFEKAHTGNDDY